jgi:putative peptidoglycan lipid II flippase
MAWAPLANNIVCIVVLFVFHLSNPHPTLGGLHGRTLLLLGGGTTLGVLVQYLVLTPALHRAKLTRLRWHLDLRDEGVRKVMRLGGWTTANVVANQVSLAVILALAFGLGGTGSVSAYTYGWSFMQMPYAVVVVSVLNALTPALAADASQGQLRRVETNARRGLTNSLYVIVPATVFLVGLAQPIVALLFQHGNAQSHHLAGVALAVLAIGLPGFTVFAVMVRLLQTMQHGRDTFFLYAVQNVLTIFLAFAWGRHSLAGLLGSISVAYTLAAALAVLILSTRSVNVVPSFLDPSLWRLCGASLAGGLAMVLAYNAVGWQQGVALFIRAGCAGIIGILVVSLLTKPLWKRFLPFSANRDKVDGE